jgi:hypothetical protein
VAGCVNGLCQETHTSVDSTHAAAPPPAAAPPISATPRCANPDLHVVLVGAWSQADLLELQYVPLPPDLVGTLFLFDFSLPMSAIRQTGGSAVATTSTTSRPASSARWIASSSSSTPTCCPCCLMRRTFGAPIWRLIRGPVGTVGRWLVDVLLTLATPGPAATRS